MDMDMDMDMVMVRRTTRKTDQALRSLNAVLGICKREGVGNTSVHVLVCRARQRTCLHIVTRSFV